MINKHIVWAFALLLGVCLLAPAAFADEGEGQSPEEKLKEQVEKILKLMKANREALLKLSTGGKDKPRDVEVKIDPPPSSSSSSSGSEGGSSGSEGGSSGSEGGSSGSEGSSAGSSGNEGGASGSSGGERTREELQKAIRELLKGQQASSGMIPGELSKLVKMIPEGQGQGQGQGKPQDNSGKGKGGQEQPEGEPRDGTKKLDEQGRPIPEEKPGGEKNPQGGEDNPRDPNDRSEGKKDPNGTEQPKDPDDDVELWKTRLPAEYRDAVMNGDFSKIPAEYRSLVERYLKWLNKNGAKK